METKTALVFSILYLSTFNFYEVGKSDESNLKSVPIYPWFSYVTLLRQTIRNEHNMCITGNKRGRWNITFVGDAVSVELSSESVFWWLRRSKRITEPKECPPRETGPLKSGLRWQYKAYSLFISDATVSMMCCQQEMILSLHNILTNIFYSIKLSF